MRIAVARVLGGVWLLAGCAAQPATAPAEGPVPVPAAPALEQGAVRWTAAVHPELDLWYHGLAQTGFGASAEAPIYQAGYAERIQAAKRAAGVHATVLDERAAEFRRLFDADARFTSLQFLPLYFARGDELFAALHAWIQAGGDARRVQGQGRAQAVAFLARQLPTAEERRTVAAWLDVLEEERRVFYDAYRQGRQVELSRTASAVQREWDRIAPGLRPVLDYLILNQGEIVLSPPIGPEGRTLDLGRRNNRVATLEPESARPADAVWAVLHELMYSYVGTVIEDRLAPAQRRTEDDQVLSRRAAIRAGAILLDRVAPRDADDYRSAYLRWADAPVPASDAERQAAFERAYPLPDPLPDGLVEGLDSILRGI